MKTLEMENNTEERKLWRDIVDEKAKKNNTIDLYAYSMGVIDGIERQTERMFTEEEVYKLICNMPNFSNMSIPQQIEARKNWFEQNKKTIV